jgi:uncharacterized membrane protein YfhO
LYKYSAPTDVSAQVAVVYFPGWELRIDNQEQNDDISMEDNGLVRLKLPAGVHTAELKYGLSPIGRIAQKISYFGWAIRMSLVTMPALKI